MRSILVYLFAVVSSSLLSAQIPMFETPLSPRIANYNINVSLNPDTRQLTGKEILTWRNDSADLIDQLQFHLYLNAFKNQLSTYMKESMGSRRHRIPESDDGWGWIEITGMVLNRETDLKNFFKFIQPDDDNSDDQTVLKIDLPVPVKAGDIIRLDIDFIARLPEVIARTGYKDHFYMVGQWFPKIGVYEHAGERHALKGEWNCHQFHRNSEFYADYGIYEVTINVPEDYVVGATGVLLNETIHTGKTKSLTYYCEDVHDFAWTADPDYIVIEDQWRHVKIRFLAHPGHDSQAGRHIQAAKNALAFFDEWLGYYPYPTLTIVDPRYKAFAAGGMEYPTLITAGTLWLLPEGIRLPEIVTVHEFGHNYWYGIVGSNEFEEAWLDEGINTYSELKIMEKYYSQQGGTAISFLGLNIDDVAFQWSGYTARAKWDAVYRKAWEYKRGGYATFSYNKPALMLLTLENYLGENLMNAVMKTYYERYKFKHPDSGDFIKTVNDVSGEDLNWFFKQVLYGTDVLDYKIDRITVTEIPHTYKGVFGDPLHEKADKQAVEADEASAEEKTDSLKTMVRSRVVAARQGEVIYPVEILVKFEDGSERMEKWDGKQRYRIFEYQSPQPVIAAEVDPQRKIWLDVNFLNNGKNTGTNQAASMKYGIRWLFWMQNLLQFISIFS